MVGIVGGRGRTDRPRRWPHEERRLVGWGDATRRDADSVGRGGVARTARTGRTLIEQDVHERRRVHLLKWDLLEGPGRAVRPSDYCREFSPEDVIFFRSAEFRDLNAADQCERIADRLVEVMGVDEGLLFSDVGGEAVEMMVNRFKGLHCELIRLRAVLLRAIRKQWPGTTHADWDALGSQPHA